MDSELTIMLAQVREEEIEYQPGYWVWQMEVEIRDAFVKAVRKYANPDYEATAILQYKRNMYQPAYVVWADLSEGDKSHYIKRAKIDVAAALGVE